MSLLHSLQRWVDVNQHREDEAAKKSWQTLLVTGEVGDGDGPRRTGVCWHLRARGEKPSLVPRVPRVHHPTEIGAPRAGSSTKRTECRAHLLREERGCSHAAKWPPLSSLL